MASRMFDLPELLAPTMAQTCGSSISSACKERKFCTRSDLSLIYAPPDRDNTRPGRASKWALTHFVRDFNFLSLSSTISERAQNPANGLDITVEIPFRLYQDFTTNTEFIAVSCRSL